jgi:hypothetical protein
MDILSLPNDLLFIILSFLSKNECHTLSLVCIFLKKIISNMEFVMDSSFLKLKQLSDLEYIRIMKYRDIPSFMLFPPILKQNIYELSFENCDIDNINIFLNPSLQKLIIINTNFGILDFKTIKNISYVQIKFSLKDNSSSILNLEYCKNYKSFDIDICLLRKRKFNMLG